ncbi:MAG: hypothetical protein RI988_3479 [Pseudomonadota bacterium]
MSDEPDEVYAAWEACACDRYKDEENGNPLGLPQGMPNIDDFKDGYRAGQAASAERIKALEEEIAAMQEIPGNLRVEMSDMLTRLHELHPEDFVWLKEADQ